MKYTYLKDGDPEIDAMLASVCEIGGGRAYRLTDLSIRFQAYPETAARAEAADYAEAVEALFARDIEAIGRAAREKAVSQFAWNRVFADLCHLYGDLTGEAAFMAADAELHLH